MYERVKEHLRDAKDLQKDSHIVKHWFLDHPQQQTQPKFKFKIVGKFKDCMTRQISEAVRLSLRPGSLNSKGEYGRCNIPRLVIQEDEYDRKRKERETMLDEIAENRKWEAFLKARDTVKDATADQVNELEGEHGLHYAGDLRKRRLLTKRTAPPTPENAPDQPSSKRKRVARLGTEGMCLTKTEKTPKRNVYDACDPETFLEECRYSEKKMIQGGQTSL